MKNLLLIILFPLYTYAQDWAPTGARWTYSQKTVNPYFTTYSSLESKNETIKVGKRCQFIEELKRAGYLPPDTIKHYMYSEKNKVYFLKDSLWCLLYDFNAQEGDTFKIGCILNYRGDPLIVKIQSVVLKNINGKLRKVFNYLADDMVRDFSGTVIEGIGRTFNMFPGSGSHDTRLMGPLRCYEDSELGVYKNELNNGAAWKDDCNAIITGNEVGMNKAKFKAYPNPITNDIFQIELIEDENQIQIIDILGRVIIKQSCSNSCIVDLSVVPNGPYILKVMDNQNGNSSQWIVKNDQL